MRARRALWAVGKRKRKVTSLWSQESEDRCQAASFVSQEPSA